MGAGERKEGVAPRNWGCANVASYGKKQRPRSISSPPPYIQENRDAPNQLVLMVGMVRTHQRALVPSKKNPASSLYQKS